MSSHLTNFQASTATFQSEISAPRCKWQVLEPRWSLSPRLCALSSRQKAPGCASLQHGVFHWLRSGHLGGAEQLTGLTSSRGQAAQPTTNMGSHSLPQLPSAMPHSLGLNASPSRQLSESLLPRCAHQVRQPCPSTHRPPQGTSVAALPHPGTLLVPLLPRGTIGAAVIGVPPASSSNTPSECRARWRQPPHP